MDKIDFFADEYSKNAWQRFARCFKQVDIVIEGIPQDIVNAVCGILGINTAVNWLKTPLNSLEGKTAVELVQYEKGCQALKALIMRLPN